jgi:hypothetical protein
MSVLDGAARNVAVTIAGMADFTFTAAYVEAARWNGWAKPWFTAKVAKKIASRSYEEYEKDPEVAQEYFLYTSSMPAARRVWWATPGEQDYGPVGAIQDPDGRWLYGVGTSNWTWEEVRTDSSHPWYSQAAEQAALGDPPEYHRDGCTGGLADSQGNPPPSYVVKDFAEGKSRQVGGRFATEGEAAAFIMSLPEHWSGRYSIEGPGLPAVRDRNGIPMPDGWAVYFNGKLVFSVDKATSIGDAIRAIMDSR